VCCGKADEQTGHWHALAEHGPQSAGRRGFLELDGLVFISAASRVCISVLTDHRIILESYINRGPKIDLLFLLSSAFISCFLSFPFRCLDRFRLISGLKCYTEELY